VLLLLLITLGLAQETSSLQVDAPHSKRAGPWTVGMEFGAGMRLLPMREIPKGPAPRLDLFVIDVRRDLAEPVSFSFAPDRLDFQLDWMHGVMTRAGSTRARYPLCAYATWVQPARRRRELALSAGLYTEFGLDRYVVNERLSFGPGHTLAAAGRIGFEKPRRWRDATTLGTYLRVAAGVSLGSDPNHATATQYFRVGLERGWAWGRRIVVVP